jgi:DNA-binding NtrC family response regulator
MATAITPATFSMPKPSLTEIPQCLNLLIVDKDRFVREACRDAALALGCRASATDSIDQALWLVNAQNIDLILLDWNIQHRGVCDFLHQLKRQRQQCEIVVMLNNDQVRAAGEAVRAGGFDCICKPFGLMEIRLIVERVSEHLTKMAESKTLPANSQSPDGFGDLIGCTREMEKLYRLIDKAARSRHPVLILGESGTGKELVARSIHRASPIREKPFIPIDCGSLVPTLIESELFGHVKGAFTGATHSKNGLLSIAEEGTVFLDEVGELPIDLQSKLLRAIQEREIRPVGGTQNIPINVRILAATNRDLEHAVGRGEFRRDLYFRLNVLTLRVPSLRERHQDIQLLVERFLEREEKQTGRCHEISDEVLDAMVAYDWPGNVRELENCIEQCCALNSGPTIHITDLPPSMVNKKNSVSSLAPDSRIVSMADIERRAILGAIERLKGDKLRAARLLGIGKTTLYRKLKQYQTVH